MNTERSTSRAALPLLWLVGGASRLTILAIPPILALLIIDLGLSGTQVGILNAIPTALFSLVAIPGALLIARVGAVNATIFGLLLTAAGSALRGAAPSVLTLFAATVVMSAGVALMQPALPPLVRQWSPKRISFATAIYTNGLLCGEIIPVALAGTLLVVLGSGWRGTLVFWSVWPVLIAVLVFFTQPGGKGQPIIRNRRWMPDWRDPLVWKVGLALGANNQLYFCTNAFLPGLLLQNGQTELIGPALSALNAGQLPASFLILAFASRIERRRWPLIVAGVVGLVSIIGIVLSPSGWGIITAAALIGFSCAVGLTILFSLPALLVGSDDVSRLSAGSMAIGYSMAVAISLIAGVVWEYAGDAVFAFLPIAVTLIFIIVCPLMIDFRRQRS